MADNPFAQFAPAAAPNPFAKFAPAGPAAVPTGPRDAATVQAEYDAKPWYGQLGTAADDIVRLIANGMTFGYADKFAGAMNGSGAEAERTRTAEAQTRAGSAGTAAEIGGSLALPLGGGVTTAGRFGTAAMQGAGGLAARTGLAAAEGAGYGALNAAGHDQDIGDGALFGAIMGTAAQPLAEGVSHVASGTAGLFNRQPRIPTLDEVRAAGNAAYDAADAAGVVFTPQMVDRVRQQVVTQLADMGYDPALQPGAAAVLRRLDDLLGQNVSLRGLDTVRKVASNGYQRDNPSNNRAIGLVIDAIDNAISGQQAGDVLVGNGQAGADALQEARRLWAQGAKAQQVDDAVHRADMRAASTGAGGNIDNTTRQNLRRIAENPRGYTPDELGALETAVYGTPGQNFLRHIGKLAPTGVVSGGIGAAMGANLGHIVGGPVGSAVGSFTVPAIGQAAKSTADAMGANNTQRLLDIILAGGTQAATQAPPNAVQRGAQAARDPLVSALIQAGIIGGQ